MVSSSTLPNNSLMPWTVRPGQADPAGWRKGRVPGLPSYATIDENLPKPPGSTLAKPAHRPDLLREERV